MINPNLFYIMENTKYDRIELRKNFQSKIEKNGEKLKIAFNESKRKLIYRKEFEDLISDESSDYIYD